MVNDKYGADKCKSVTLNIRTIMKNLEMLKFIPDHLKTKKMCKHAVKKLHFVIRYVGDQYKVQVMCYKAILRNGTI